MSTEHLATIEQHGDVHELAMQLGSTMSLPIADVHQSANSYFGLFRQAGHSHHDRARLANAVRRRGHSINGSLTKAYP